MVNSNYLSLVVCPRSKELIGLGAYFYWHVVRTLPGAEIGSDLTLSLHLFIAAKQPINPTLLLWSLRRHLLDSP